MCRIEYQWRKLKNGNDALAISFLSRYWRRGDGDAILACEKDGIFGSIMMAVVNKTEQMVGDLSC